MFSELEILIDELKDDCEYIDFCARYPHVIPENMRWKYCHEEKEECIGRRVVITLNNLENETFFHRGLLSVYELIQ